MAGEAVSSPGVAGPRGAVLGAAGAVVVCALVATFVLTSSTGAGTFVLAAIGVTSVAGMVWGCLVHRPRPLLAWWLLVVAGVGFLAGSAVRPWSLERSGAAHYLVDVLSLSGYLALLLALVKLARAHGGLRREVLCDVLIAGAAGALAAVQHLVVPLTLLPGRSVATSVLAAVYPLVDVLLVCLVIDLLFAAPRRRSYQLMLAAVIALLAGDVWYAAFGVRGELLPPLVVSTPFVVAYLLITAAALHPSQRQDAPAGAKVADAWSWRRLVLLSVSLAALVLLLAVRPAGGSPLTRWAGVATVAVVLALLLLRAVSAVNGQARARALLAHRASHDPLTDLPNRDGLRQQLAELTAQPSAAQGRHWLFYVDLDGFKRVNDTRGHHAGDELLQVTGARLREIAGSGGTVARLAGDEFVVLAGGDEGRMREIADRLVRELARPVRVAGADAVVTASVGVSAVRSSAQTAMREADTAMYQAKKDGRGQWLLFDATMRSDQGAAVELELHLRHAVDEDALTCAYQLIVDIGTGRPVGAEALLRWERPLSGPVSPVEFVPLLEETGLINRVGLSTLRRALLQLARWREQGLVDHDFRMSVNVAPRQLLDPAFADLVRTALAEAGVEGGSLILEITESSVLADSEVVMDTLQALRRMGIGLAVDDFGTGYSALSYLRTLPVTRVKIDRSFVANLGEDSSSDEALVRAVVAVSAALGLGVTAEGIETDAQREILRRLAVRHGQGWLWARAADPETVGAVLASWSRRAVR